MNFETTKKTFQDKLKQGKGKQILSFLLLFASLLTSLGGIAAFIYLFVLDFNIYWFILSPIIFALYQSPAVYLYWLWKKKF